MHIPDAYLSPITQAAGFALAAPLLVVAARKTQRSLSTKQVPLLSVGAAFCFAVQMFNIPAVGGTTAHALGTVLLAILLGPWAALITMTLNLTIQALFFGDGGVLSLGANVIDMAIIPSFVGSFLYQRLSSQGNGGLARSLTGAAIAAYAGTSIASLSAGLILGLQPVIAHDSAGHALYFPFGWSVSVPAMVITHLLVAAPAEAMITVAALAYVWRNFPDLARAEVRARTGSGLRLGRTVGLVLLLTPLGLIAGGSAWGEWDPEDLRKLVGYVPSGAAKAHDLVRPLLPDYALPNAHGLIWDVAGYLVSALVGGVFVAVATRTFMRGAKPTSAQSETRLAPQAGLPNFLTKANPSLAATGRATQRSWIEALLLRMKGAIEETVASEKVAKRPGLLQRTPPVPKALIILGALVATALVRRPEPLVVIAALVFLAALASQVPIAAFGKRVVGSVLFFGAIVALPLALQSVTPGHIVFGRGPLALSEAGLIQGGTMLLRLCCGIGLSLLWTVTTRWHSLIRSLRSLGVPSMFCSAVTLAYRYLFVTIETLEEMATARRSRQLGQVDKHQARAYSGAGAAILFGKSYAFMEELHMAMRSRCYELKTKPQPSRKPSDRRGVLGAAIALLNGSVR